MQKEELMSPDHSLQSVPLVGIALAGLLSAVFAPHVWAQAILENPRNDSFYSGIGVISGWKCGDNGPLTCGFPDGYSV